MKIGDTLYLEIENNQNEIERYRCKLIDQNTDHLFVDYPVHDRTRKSKFLPRNKRFHVTYRNKQNVYKFSSYVVKHMKGSIPTLAISLPSKSEHKRIQRREYVRVETAVDVALHCPKQLFAPFTTVSSDISGGGLSVFVNEHVFQDNHEVDVQIVLEMNSQEFHYITAKASFIRYQDSGSGMAQTASLMFTSISKQSQQQIIQYCFEKQRDERKKELYI